jgi:hypothetical protein
MDGPVNDFDVPKGAHIEYAVCYPDTAAYMDGPRTTRLGRFETLEEAQTALDIVYKRHRPEAWIESRIVFPWQRVL